jgi:5-methylcytosine-specific restriction endonuclease McrA
MEDVGFFRCIATLTWHFESSLPPDECLKYAKDQLDKILDTHPQGEDFEDFNAQVDIVRMKDRIRLVHIGEFTLEDVFSHITSTDTKREYVVKDKSYFVRMNSDRYFVFRDNPNCVACGLRGTRMMLDVNPVDQSPHFNLYGEHDGRLVLMTKDHIIPRSRGGADEINNLQSMCCLCNNLKADADLTIENVRELRKMYDNEEKIPKKELRERINNRREEMAVNRRDQ